MAERIIAHLHATLGDGTEVMQGQTVEVSDEDAKRLGPRAFVPEDFDSFEAYSDYLQDAYRGSRGDLTAAGRLQEAREGGIVDLSPIPDGTDPEVRAIAQRLTDEGLTVDETVALAEGDPAKAQAVLDAENLATGASPRKGVEDGLAKITSGE